MNTKLSSTKQLALGGMATAITVLCLYAASVLPVGRIPLCFLASVVLFVLTCEGANIMAAVSFLASAVIAVVISPDRLPAFAYMFILGHYGIIWTLVHTRIKGKILQKLIMLLYFDIFLYTGLFLALRFIAGFSLVTPEGLPVWVFAVLLQIAAVVFDILYEASTKVYQSFFRHLIVPRH